MPLPSQCSPLRSILWLGFRIALIIGGLTSLTHAALPSTRWTWMSGDNIPNLPAVYGTLGVPAPANNPGARRGSVTWKDGQGNLWLYGGFGAASGGWQADLWKYDVSLGQWAWIKGSNNSGNPYGTYGSKGVPSSSNKPGARYRAVSWTDTQGRFWLFGGDGYATSGGSAGLNDLWMYDPNPGNSFSGKWTWMHGTNQRNHEGVYGSQGVAAASNIPPNRAGAVSWSDGAGNLWLFGGAHVPVSGPGYPKLNDLWKYNIATNQWTWVKGTNTVDAAGSYGTMGSGTSSTRPGGRFTGQGWTDQLGRLWLYGGYGFATSSTEGWLNDLWRFDPATNIWTWLKGTNSLDQSAHFGTIANPSSFDRPGGLQEAITWTDAQGDLWLYGGTGYSTGGNFGDLSALWRYNVASNVWTWMNGTQSVGVNPTFGTIGNPNSYNTNTPGGLHAAAAWVGDSNSLWLFGGEHYNPSIGNPGYSVLWQLDENSGISISSDNFTHANNSSVDFGFASVGATVTRTFTIRNDSNSIINNLNVTLGGGQNDNYSITTPPSSSLMPGQEVTFDIAFKPNVLGAVTAKINVSYAGKQFSLFATGTGTLPAVTLTTAPDWVWEDAGTPLAFIFKRAGDTTNPLTVNFSVNGNATLNTDYTSSGADSFTVSAGTVTIPSGSATASVMIAPVSDTTAEVEENVQLNLVPSTAYNNAYPNTAAGVIASEELLPGGRDHAFYPVIIGNYVAATAKQTDGKLVIGGSFTSVNGVQCTNLARLNSDGTLDSGFSATIHQYFPVTGILVQPDGRILVTGGASDITRLLGNGDPDPSFTSPFSLAQVYAVAQQPDGKILVGGNFTMVGNVARNRLARLNTDGTLDTSFDPGPGADNWVNCLAVQPDGQILVGGSFASFGGQPRNGITRLNPDGTLDPNFDTGSGITGSTFFSVLCFAIQPDGRILIGGEFNSYNGQSRSRIARLESNGSLDLTFNPTAATDDFIYTLALQIDGKVLLGGYFYTINGQSSPFLARLNADGAFDSTFQVGWGPTNGVLGITLLGDGQVIAYGNDSIVDESHSLISRRANGPATQTLRPASGSVAQWQRTGTGPELSRMTFDLSTDGGVNWSPLGAGTRITGGWQINGQILPMSGHLRARGFAESGYFSATSSIIEQIQPFTRTPEIVVEDPGSASLTDGVSVFDFGPQTYPPTLGSGTRGFTIRNIGNADLTDLAVSLDGDHAGDFSFNGPFPYTAPLAPGAVRNIQFTFTSQAMGTRNAMLHIGSNDADENLFDIAFTGLGATAQEVWRHANFGSLANSGPGADTSDPDGDGNSNQFEFLAGLNPTASNSRFRVRVEAVPGSPNQRKIFFTALPLPFAGSSALVIKYTTTLRANDWHPLNNASIDTSGPEWFIIDTDAGGPMKFYRIELSAP